MKPVTIISLAVTTVATLIPLNAAIAQSVGQLRACRDYVASRREFQDIPYSAIQVFDRGSSNSGRAAVDWRINRIRNATGYCIVDRRERVTDFRITQNSGSGNIAGNLETNWGNPVRPYRARITSDDTTIVNRPDHRNKRDIGEVRRNESITVYRTYYESSSRITWYLIEGSRRQRGWINANRVSSDNDNSSNGDLETNWGNSVRPYRARIISDNTTIVNRPDRRNKRDIGEVRRNESITVYRTYYESSSRITWYLIEGSRRQRGWINANRVSSDNDNSSNGDLETNWGNSVRPYRARIISDNTTIVNRPDRRNKRDIGEVRRNESITVYRTYYESSSRITWYLIEGSRRQRGWINADRVDDRVGDGDNDFGEDNNVETNWGNAVRPYRAVIGSDDTTIVNRPNRSNKRDVERVSRNESITVLRTYYESSSRITWYLIRGSRGQEGWINSDRVLERSPR